MEKIRIKNLTFRYPLGRQNTLENIDLSIGEAAFVVVCGKSGCGKTTLLRQMKKSLAPYGERSGEIFYAGAPLEELDARRDAAEIGFVLQNPESQLVTDKVWHELAFGLENLGLPRREIQRRVAEMASYFGIHSWFRKDVSELSGGQKQMLNLASVMAMQPQILILDEPTSQLDPIAATDFLSMLHRIHRDFGTTIILSEHNLEEAFPLATQAVVLEDGRIAAQGSPSEIGRTLARGDGKEPHPMYFGMPAPMRVIPESMTQGRELPLTIREGRLLLEEILASSDMGEKEVRLLPRENEEAAASRGEGDACIQLRDVWFRYDRASEPVLRGLDMEVASGEIYCLLGGNGSGKTTTIKALAGLLLPQRGKIKIREGARTALVPQEPMALFTEITVEEEVLEGMADLHGAQRMADEEKIDRVEEMLRLMEIEHLRKANPYDLSGGEQQRLAIAKVMACAPDILLLDEPTKGLDPFFKRTLGERLRQLAAGGTTVLLVSHDIDFCVSYGHTCALFFDGQITAAGEAGEFFRGNNYYTTSANKMVRRWRSDIVLVEEARAWLEELL